MEDKQLKKLADMLGQSFAETMEPMMADLKDDMNKKSEAMEKHMEASNGLMQDMVETMSNMEMPEMPELKMPVINVPEPRVTVNVPAMKMPEMRFPDQRPIFSDINFKNPLPIILTDMEGKPYSAQQINQSGGGGFRNVVIGDIRGSMASLIDQNIGALKVTGDFNITNSATSTYAALSNADGAITGTNPLPVVFGASATQAVNIVDSSGIGYSGSNPVPVVFGASATQGVNLVDSSGIAYSGSNAVPITGTVSDITNSLKAALIDSSGVQYSGSNPVPIGGTLTAVTDITNSLKSALIDSSGVQYSGSNPVPVTWVSGAGVSTTVNISDSSGVGYSGSNPVPITWVSGAGVSTTVNIGDSSGVGYSGSNPLPITLVSGALTSTIAVGPVVADAIDDGSAPVQSGGVARTANPTAVSGNDVVKSTHDDLGRQVFRAHQVRDLISTARVAITTGTETTLLAAVAGSYLDLMSVMMANSSDVAVSVDLRAVTAGNIVQTVQVPASGTAGWSPATPWPQDETGNNWTADMGDITGTTVTISALFAKEV